MISRIGGIVLGFIAVGLIVLGGFGFVSALQLVPPTYFSAGGLSLDFNLATESVGFRVAWAAAGLSTLLVGMIILTLFGRRAAAPRDRVVLRATDPAIYGSTRVTISERALIGLVARAAQDVRGVREAEASAALTDGSWRVKIKIAVLPSAELPDIARAVDRAARESLEHHTGILVDQLDIHSQFEPLRVAAARVA